MFRCDICHLRYSTCDEQIGIGEGNITRYRQKKIWKNKLPVRAQINMNNSEPRNRAPIVFGASLVQFTIIGGLFAYGVFFSALESELGWSRTVMSACTSLAFLIMGLLAISAGKLSDRFGPRWVLFGSGLIYGIGYSALYFISEPWHAILLFGIAVGVGMATHDIVTLSTIARWFHSMRGRMTGVVKVGTAFGQISVPFIAALLISEYGWRLSFFIIGVVALFLLLLAAVLIGGNTPAPIAKESQPTESEGISLQDARRTRQFWSFCVMQFMFFPSLMSIPVHIAIHAEDLGFSVQASAAVLSSIGAVSILGRLTLGWGIDRIGGKRGYIICFTLLVASLLLLLQIDNPKFLFVFALLYGFAHFFGTLSGATGPLVAGWIYDTYGSYDRALLLFTAMAVGGLLISLSLTKKF